jgi:hypothetical protein
MKNGSAIQSEATSGNPYWIPTVFLLTLWGVVAIILLTPESPNGHGVAHSTYAEMDQGGDGADRHKAVLVSGWIFGSLLIVLFVGLLAWGMAGQPCRTETSGTSRAEKSASQRWIFLIGGLLFEGVFAAMCLAYRNSLTGSEVAFLGPFPAALSWMLFGIWVFPTYFIVHYVVFFDRYIMPPQSVQRFETLLGQAPHADDSST